MSEIKVNSTGEVKLFDSDNSNYVSIKSPATVGSNQTFVLPDADGSANNALKTDGSGNLGFVDVTSLVTQGIKWQSTLKTSDFTAVSGEAYFVNTSGGAVTATLPASPSAGAIVAFKDYAPSFATNNLTIGRNSSNIQGNAVDSVLSTNRASVVMVYIDSTKGWLFVQESNVGDLQDKEYVTASGGTETTSGDYKIHTFNSSGTFTVSNAGNAAGSNTVSYMIIAGGGGGGKGGGGAGGYRESKSSFDSYSSPPIASSGGLSVSAQAYPITVGAGGNGAPNGAQSQAATGGEASVFSTVTSTGGGGGAGDNGGQGGLPGGANGPGAGKGGAGGSGGGGSNGSLSTGGATIAVPAPSGGGETAQGFAGESHPHSGGGGGGGATEAGGTNGDSDGGDGSTTSINGSPVSRGGGGGGGGFETSGSPGGSGGGGAGGNHPNGNGTAGSTNTGGGGGGGSGAPGGNDGDGANGGSGVVIIRYKYQN
jgi:hypothetical protein